MKKKEPLQMLSLFVSPAMRKEIEALAVEHCASVSAVLRALVREALVAKEPNGRRVY